MRKTRGGWGETGRRHRTLSQVAHVLFSLCSFWYVRTILSESLAQAKLKSTLRTDFSEVKSFSGFRVRLQNPKSGFQNLNPDFPIERNLVVRREMLTVFSSYSWMYFSFYRRWEGRCVCQPRESSWSVQIRPEDRENCVSKEGTSCRCKLV